MRKLLIALVAVVAVAAAIWRWPARELRIEPVEASRSDSGEEQATPRPVDAAAPVAMRSDESAGKRADESEKIAAADGQDGDASPPRLDPNATRGRILLRDVNGAEIAAGSGTLRGTGVGGPGVYGVESIAVDAGRFSVAIPELRAFEPHRLELDGQQLHVAAKRILPDPNGELVVEARQAKLFLLHVRDAATGAPLRDVTVVRCWKMVIGDHAHSAIPSSDERVAESEEMLVRGGVSPMAIGVPVDEKRLLWITQFCVVAPGHAWATRPVDLEIGGDVTFDLLPGGSVEVALAGDVSLARADRDPSAGIWEDPLIRVRRRPEEQPEPEPFDLDAALAEAKERIASATEGELAMWFDDGVVPDEAALRALLLESREQELLDAEAPQLQWPIADPAPSLDGPTRIEGLLPGRYDVTLERGSDWSKALVFARMEAVVRAGETTRATLVAAPVVRPQPAPFSGRLRLAPAWGADGIDLQFQTLDVPGRSRSDEFQLRLEIDRESGSEWHPFDAGSRLPGRWLVRASDYEFQQIVDSGPVGRSDLEIVISDPADVAIRLVDAVTGAPILSDVPNPVHWWCTSTDPGSDSSPGKTTWSAGETCYRCRAPAGEIEVMLDSKVWRLYDGVGRQRVRVAPGANEVRIVLRRLQALELRFEVDGRPPADWVERFAGMEVELESSTTGKRRRGCDDLDYKQTMWFRLPDPGRWRVVVPPIPGYRPIEPFEVDIAAQEITIHRVALVRDGG